MSKTPKLRFKEFNGDWESEKLGNLLEFKNGINASKEQYGHGKKFINVLDILNNNYITYENIIGKVDVDEDTFEKYSVGYGDIVFQRSSETREEVGTANVYLDKEQKATFGGFIIRGKKVGEYNPIFMNKLLKTSSARKEITTKAGGSTRYNVGQDTLSDVEVMLPKLEEQEKIASFFSLIDDKISLQGEKVEALKDYKKGMMQKIFSRELRFKDDKGRDYPEWEDTELKEMIALTIDNRGKTPPTVQNGIPLLEVNSLGGIYPDFKQINKFVDEETYNEWFRNHIQEGDLLFTTVGATGLVSLANSTKSCIAQNIVGFRFKEGYTSKFMYNLFNYRETMKRIKAIEMGAVQPSIKVTQLIKLKFSIPSIDEQIKIGKILSSIDLKIEKEQEKLDSLNEYKKGLLQQMFV